MFRLSREVRFAVDLLADVPPPVDGRNGYAGVPPVTGMGQCYYCLAVTLVGDREPASGYLLNIKRIDTAVRQLVVPVVMSAIRDGCRGQLRGGGGVVLAAFEQLHDHFEGLRLDSVELLLSPFTSLQTTADLAQREPPMIILHHTFEFAASHRLHNPDLSPEENRRVFGKCNNPHGHGHNYQVRVSLKGEPDANGYLIDFYELEALVDEAVIAPFDHKHLNVEIPEFADLNPSVENIAMVVYQKLASPLAKRGVELDAVTVWETAKTWCEYREGARAGDDPAMARAGVPATG